jgi:hypothetical protein
LDLDSYFDQWYFGEGYPTYSVEYSYNSTGLFMAITQTTSSSVTPFFDIPLEIKLNFGAGEDTIFRVPITDNITYFQTGITDDIIVLQVDPNNWIVNKVNGITVGTSELRNDMEFVIGPNPTNGQLQIHFGQSNSLKQISITDLSGREVRSLSTRGNMNLDISDLNNGYYLVKATDGESSVTRKIMKR